MKSTKSKLSSRRPITTKKIKTLVKKALADSFQSKPAKGYKYLVDIEKGSMFETATGLRGVYLSSTPTSAKVIIVSCKFLEEDKSYYLGKQNIGNTTEVKNG
tara:strand:+ start:484 stop:789 length:306 start_codon:yes stop_codon:yes gene_type:complete